MKVTKYFWNGAEIRWESGVGSNIKQFLLRTSGVYTEHFTASIAQNTVLKDVDSVTG